MHPLAATTATFKPSCCHTCCHIQTLLLPHHSHIQTLLLPHYCHIQTLLLPHFLPHTNPLAATPLPHSNLLLPHLLPHIHTNKQASKQNKQTSKQSKQTQHNKTKQTNKIQNKKQNKTKQKQKQNKTNKQTNKWNKQVKQTNKCLLIEIHFQYFPIIYVITLRFTDPSCLHFLARNGKAKAQRATCWASFGVPVWDLGAFHRRMAVGARQCGSRGVAVWQSGHGSVAVGAWRRGAAPLPHATATLKAPQCHTDTPKLAQHVASCALALPFVAKTCKQEGLVNRSVIT